MARIVVMTDSGEMVGSYGRDVTDAKMFDLAGDITDAAMDLLLNIVDDVRVAQTKEKAESGKGGTNKGGK